MASTFPHDKHSQFVEGLRVPATFSAEAVLSAIRYQPRDDDVFVVTYPKCGTTWTQHIVALIFRQGEPFPPEKFFSIAPFMEIAGFHSTGHFTSTMASQFVEGLQIPATFSAEGVRFAMRYQPKDGDVFLATYPKCGTVWTQHIIALIFRHGDPFPFENFFTIAPFLEMSGAKSIENMPRPGAFATHLSYHLAPRSEKAKYIYVTRNPKDCCVSFYHQVKNIRIHGFKGDFDEFFEMFLSGNVDFGDYFDHLMGWYQHRNDPNVLFMTYEAMKEDTKAAILKIASFIDDKLYAEPLRNDPKKLNNVLKHSSFENMKQTFNKNVSDILSMSKEEIMKSDLPDGMKKAVSDSINLKEKKEKETPSTVNFVRKGIIGDWRNYFSEDQNRRMDEKFADRTKGTDIPNLWKEYI